MDQPEPVLGPAKPDPGDSTGIEVHHHRQIQPALTRRDVGDVSRPTLVRRLGFEVLLQQVLRNGMRPITVRGDLEAPLGTSPKPLQAHQTCDFVASYANTLSN